MKLESTVQHQLVHTLASNEHNVAQCCSCSLTLTAFMGSGLKKLESIAAKFHSMVVKVVVFVVRELTNRCNLQSLALSRLTWEILSPTFFHTKCS